VSSAHPPQETSGGAARGTGEDGTDQAALSRTVCDYIAGLSDREALNEHARLFDPFVTS
jgi:dGTP triphosphohydrolase